MDSTICFEDHKKMKQKLEKYSWFSKSMAIRLSVHIGLILNVILAVGYSYNGYLLLENLPLVLPAALSTILLFYILFRYNFYIIQIRNQKRIVFFLRSAGGSLVATIVFSLLVSFLILCWVHVPEGKSIFISVTLMKDLITGLIVQLTTMLMFSLYQNQQFILKNEKLITENIYARYEALKNQVDPHFLFNSLNTLDGLIRIDTRKAHEYLQKLSAVFRYTIGDKSIIHLQDELDFTKSYIDLMRIRYGENLKVELAIEPSALDRFIMPVSLQLLVENAIKHNVISNRQPLIIYIETISSTRLKVTNHLQPKINEEPGEGVGLGNLAERYSLLFGKEIVVLSDEDFSVEVPLLEPSDLEKLDL